MTSVRMGPDWLLVAMAAVAVIAVLFLPPIPQDPAYHLLSDRTTVLAIPNFRNVVSNLPFLLVGAFGLARATTVVPRPTYLVFCTAVILVGIGSAWYHYAPGNDTLVWDRIPMTIAFMALFSLVIGDRVSARLGRRLLWPLVISGVAAVMYWDWTELQGRGDLRPYALVQFLPMLLIPVMLLRSKGNGLRTSWLWATVAVYGLAKLAEFYDHAIHAATGIISGHSVKHLLGALAVYLAMCSMRAPRRAG